MRSENWKNLAQCLVLHLLGHKISLRFSFFFLLYFYKISTLNKLCNSYLETLRESKTQLNKYKYTQKEREITLSWNNISHFFCRRVLASEKFVSCPLLVFLLSHCWPCRHKRELIQNKFSKSSQLWSSGVGYVEINILKVK